MIKTLAMIISIWTWSIQIYIWLIINLSPSISFVVQQIISFVWLFDLVCTVTFRILNVKIQLQNISQQKNYHHEQKECCRNQKRNYFWIPVINFSIFLAIFFWVSCISTFLKFILNRFKFLLGNVRFLSSQWKNIIH
jgi:hypothetical protein